MAKYKITIVETSSRTVEIELNNALDGNDALSIIKQHYYEKDIILDAEDFDDVDFIIYRD